MSNMKKIGEFSETVIKLLGLSIAPGTPIYIGEPNIEHIKSRHPVEYELYYPRIGEIIADPDYVGNNTKNSSIDFVKIFHFGSDYVQVSVRISSAGHYFARTLFIMMSFKAERFIKQGALKKIP